MHLFSVLVSLRTINTCEPAGEHMPDKKRYIEEMTRVLAPRGRFSFASIVFRQSYRAAQ